MIIGEDGDAIQLFLDFEKHKVVAPAFDKRYSIPLKDRQDSGPPNRRASSMI